MASVRVKYLIFKALKTIFRLFIPILVASLVWGFFKKAPIPDPEVSIFDKLAAGAFVIFLILFTEIKDAITNFMEQIKLDKRLSFMKNRMFIYLFVLLIVLLVRYIADDTIVFCAWSAASCGVGMVCEMIEKHYYRILYPVTAHV